VRRSIWPPNPTQSRTPTARMPAASACSWRAASLKPASHGLADLRRMDHHDGIAPASTANSAVRPGVCDADHRPATAGLLDSTLVVVTSEFGATRRSTPPRRDHGRKCSAWCWRAAASRRICLRRLRRPRPPNPRIIVVVEDFATRSTPDGIVADKETHGARRSPDRNRRCAPRW